MGCTHLSVQKTEKRIFILKVAELMEIERSDNNLPELIDTKLQLNFEIKKDERY